MENRIKEQEQLREEIYKIIQGKNSANVRIVLEGILDALDLNSVVQSS